MMTLLNILIPAIPPRLSCSHSVGVTYEFVKLSIIPWGESGFNLRANIFGVSNELDAFQDNRLKIPPARNSRLYAI